MEKPISSNFPISSLQWRKTVHDFRAVVMFGWDPDRVCDVIGEGQAINKKKHTAIMPIYYMTNHWEVNSKFYSGHLIQLHKICFCELLLFLLQTKTTSIWLLYGFYGGGIRRGGGGTERREAKDILESIRVRKTNRLKFHRIYSKAHTYALLLYTKSVCHIHSHMVESLLFLVAIRYCCC